MVKPRIVVADDHDEARAAITSLLAPDFDVVATVADGQATVDAARALRPDLVVLDISMPRLSGFEVAAHIRHLPDPPWIVYATTYVDAWIDKAAYALGASAVVHKQNMLTELVPAVRRALSFHAVCFYEGPVSLARTVASFIGDGLTAGQGAIVITTASRGASIREELSAMDAGSQRAFASGELLMFEADAVLDHVLVGNRLDAQRFTDTINPIMDRAAGGSTRPVRIYGDMVDMLWHSGREDAALSLEILGNELVKGRKCSVLCAYSASVCHGEAFKVIRDRHSHVVPPHAAHRGAL
jgi:CheY-like chemotaxis protein